MQSEGSSGSRQKKESTMTSQGLERERVPRRYCTSRARSQ